jgi:hypothetical protein
MPLTRIVSRMQNNNKDINKDHAIPFIEFAPQCGNQSILHRHIVKQCDGQGMISKVHRTMVVGFIIRLARHVTLVYLHA